jgi:hypothetical protein
MEEVHAQEVVEGEEGAGFCGPMTVENLQVCSQHRLQCTCVITWLKHNY